MALLGRRAKKCNEWLDIQRRDIHVAHHHHFEIGEQRLCLGCIDRHSQGSSTVVRLRFGQIKRLVDRRTISVADELVNQIAEPRRNESGVVASDEIRRHPYSLARG